jgi:hypothetical protein
MAKREGDGADSPTRAKQARAPEVRVRAREAKRLAQNLSKVKLILRIEAKKLQKINHPTAKLR